MVIYHSESQILLMQVHPWKSNNQGFLFVFFFQNGVGTFKCYQENHNFSASIKGEIRIIVWFWWEMRSLFNAESSLTSTGQKWKCNRDKEVLNELLNELCFVRSKLTECNTRYFTLINYKEKSLRCYAIVCFSHFIPPIFRLPFCFYLSLIFPLSYFIQHLCLM